MKIVYFIDHLRPDGTQNFLGQLSSFLAGRGHRQLIFCLNDRSDAAFIDRLRLAGVEIHVIGRPQLLSGIGLVRIAATLRQERFDAAVTLLFFGEVIGRCLSALAGIPRIISSVRVRSTYYRDWQRWLLRRTAGLVDLVVLNSAHLLADAVREEGVAAEKIHVIQNGVRGADYRIGASRREIRAQLDLPDYRYLAGGVGRLSHQKGYDVLLRALHELDRRDLGVLIAGSGPEAGALQALTTELGLDDRVHFLGYQADIPHFLAALDLFIHPARFEGMPNAVLQSMAAGLPIIATAVDGIRDLIESERQGWLVPPEDPAALCRAIEAVLADPLLAQSRAQAAQTRAVRDFNLDDKMAAWEALLVGAAN